jgi:predicted lipoprotein with Yx(FWY)xxD motif
MIRNRIAVLLGTLAVVPLVSVAAAAPASAATVELRKTTELGEILTDSSGKTLFAFSIDTKKMDQCVTIMGCTTVWPPLIVTEAPTAGPGLKAKKLGILVLPDGSHQVTFKHHPLYGYAGNKGEAETSYIGAFAFGGYWYGMDARGMLIR